MTPPHNRRNSRRFCGRPNGERRVPRHPQSSRSRLAEKGRNRVLGFTVIRFRDSVQELRLRVTFGNYACNRVTDRASFRRANPVSFSRAPQLDCTVKPDLMQRSHTNLCF